MNMIVPCILGLDPGMTGACAFFFPVTPNRIAVEDMPVTDKQVVPAALARMIERFAPTHAYVEAVHSMPRDGHQAAFKFGRSFGTALGVLGALDVPMTLVTPQTWKRAYRLGGEDAKERARATAQRLFPASVEHFQRIKDHNRAEAALIALYGSGYSVTRTEEAV